jgi:hypothetical protein
MNMLTDAELDRALVDLLLSSLPMKAYPTPAVAFAREFIATYGTRREPPEIFEEDACARFRKALRGPGPKERFSSTAIAFVKHCYGNADGLTLSRQCVWWEIIETLDLSPTYFTFLPMYQGTLLKTTKRGALRFGGEVNMVLQIVCGGLYDEFDE